MAITINSLITNLLPVGAAFRGPLSIQKQQPKPEPGAISPPDNASKNQAENPATPLYTRKDARGRLSSLAPPSSASASQAEQSAEANPAAPKTSITDKEQPPSISTKKPPGEALSKSEMSLLRELQKADQSVRAHELAHLAAAGGYAKGGASFSYQRGPDGQNYAIGGEVQIDTSKEATPSANITKMQIIRQAALAPADPSPQDQTVAAQATLQIAESSRELQLLQAALSQQSATPNTTEKNTAEAAGNINQPPLDSGIASIPEAKPKKNYAAYLNPIPPANSANRQNISQIA